MFKLGFIGAPPSVKYMLEDFPTPLFKYYSSGLSGILNRISLFNVALLITVLLVTSFLSSGYMSIVGTSSTDKVKIRDFFIKGNRNWHKFFLLNFIAWIPGMLMVFDKSFIFLSFVNVIFIYAKYSFVTEEVGILENFKSGISFFFNNLGLTIKLALYFGMIFSLLSIVVFLLAKLGSIGIIINIVIIAFFGASANRAVWELYSAESGKEIEDGAN
jgi:hypothetical protein